MPTYAYIIITLEIISNVVSLQHRQDS